MNWILKFLKPGVRLPAILAGCILLLVAIAWYLEAPRWFIAMIFSLLFVLAFVLLIIRYVQRVRARAIEGAMRNMAQSQRNIADPSSRADVEELIKKWEEGIQRLKSSPLNRKGQNVLYALPWVLLIGEPGSGKTTLVQNSGLHFPSGKDRYKGVGGTKNCDWLFTNEVIFLDTAGRYSYAVSQAPDQREWKQLLKMLRKYRKSRPVDGLVLGVPVDSLLGKPEEEIIRYAEGLREKIEELIEELGVVFPVYVAILKVDKIEGFTDFFFRLRDAGQEEKLEELLGWSNPDPNLPLDDEVIDRSFEELQETIDNLRWSLFERPPGSRRKRAGLFQFPDEFASLGPPLRLLLKTIFQPSMLKEAPRLRGYYVTSGTQTGDRVTGAFLNFVKGLDPQWGAAGKLAELTEETRSFFVRDLMSRLLVADVGLALPSVGGRKIRASKFRTMSIGALAAAAVVLLLSMLSYVSNRSFLRGFQQEIDDPAARTEEVLDSSEVLEANISRLDTLRERIDAIESPPVRRRWWMNRGRLAAPAAQELFRSSFSDNTLAPVARGLRDQYMNEATCADRLHALEAQLDLAEFAAAGGPKPALQAALFPWPALAGNEPVGEKFTREYRAYLDWGGDPLKLGDADLGMAVRGIEAACREVGASNPLNALAGFFRGCENVVNLNTSQEAMEDCYVQLGTAVNQTTEQVEEVTASLDRLVGRLDKAGRGSDASDIRQLAREIGARAVPQETAGESQEACLDRFETVLQDPIREFVQADMRDSIVEPGTEIVQPSVYRKMIDENVQKYAGANPLGNENVVAFFDQCFPRTSGEADLIWKLLERVSASRSALAVFETFGLAADSDRSFDRVVIRQVVSPDKIDLRDADLDLAPLQLRTPTLAAKYRAGEYRKLTAVFKDWNAFIDDPRIYNDLRRTAAAKLGQAYDGYATQYVDQWTGLLKKVRTPAIGENAPDVLEQLPGAFSDLFDYVVREGLAEDDSPPPGSSTRSLAQRAGCLRSLDREWRQESRSYEDGLVAISDSLRAGNTGGIVEPVRRTSQAVSRMSVCSEVKNLLEKPLTDVQKFVSGRETDRLGDLWGLGELRPLKLPPGGADRPYPFAASAEAGTMPAEDLEKILEDVSLIDLDTIMKQSPGEVGPQAEKCIRTLQEAAGILLQAVDVKVLVLPEEDKQCEAAGVRPAKISVDLNFEDEAAEFDMAGDVKPQAHPIMAFYPTPATLKVEIDACKDTPKWKKIMTLGLGGKKKPEPFEVSEDGPYAWLHLLQGHARKVSDDKLEARWDIPVGKKGKEDKNPPLNLGMELESPGLVKIMDMDLSGLSCPAKLSD